MKQDVGGVDRRKFLVRMLAATLRRNVGDGAFENLEQRLLHAFAADIAGDRRVFVFLGDLIDLVDIDDALLRFLHVAIGGLQQLQNNIFDVFADVAGFGERGGVDDGERNIQHARKRLREQRFAGAGRADQKNIGLAEFHFAGLLVEEDALVMVVDSDGEFFLGAILADDIAVEKLFDFGRAGKRRFAGAVACSRFSSSRMVWQTLTHSLQM